MTDITQDELIAQARPLVEQGALVYVKWTCPGCQERATSPEPNTIHTGGYVHDEPYCGALYRGNQFGMLVIYPPSN